MATDTCSHPDPDHKAAEWPIPKYSRKRHSRKPRKFCFPPPPSEKPKPPPRLSPTPGSNTVVPDLLQEEAIPTDSSVPTLPSAQNEEFDRRVLSDIQDGEQLEWLNVMERQMQMLGEISTVRMHSHLLTTHPAR